MTIGRTYRWRTEREQERNNFVIAAARLFYRLTGGRPLSIVGIQIPPEPGMMRLSRAMRQEFTSFMIVQVPSRRSGHNPDRAPATVPSSPPISALRRPVQRPPSSALSSYSAPPPISEAKRTPSPAASSSRRPERSAPAPRPRTPQMQPPTSVRSPTPPPIVPTPPVPSLVFSESRPEFHHSASARPSLEIPVSLRSQTPQAPPLRTILSDPGPSVPIERTSSGSPARSPTRSPARSPAHSPAHSPAINNVELLPAPAPSQGTLAAPRDTNARISYFDPLNQAVADRLLTGPASPGELLAQDDDYGAETTLTNVEEMVDGFEWGDMQVDPSLGASNIGRKRARGAADQIEARLLDELMALEKVCYRIIYCHFHLLSRFVQANIHSFLESDDRIAVVMKYIDEAVSVLDEMDSYVSSYKMQLNV